MKKVTFSSNKGGRCQVLGSQVSEILSDLRYGLPTSLGQCIYMSYGLTNELLVTWAALVTLDLCSA